MLVLDKIGETVFIHEDHEFCNAINARLNRLYYIDGRDNKSRPQHSTYTGLAEKYSLPRARSEDVRS